MNYREELWKAVKTFKFLLARKNIRAVCVIIWGILLEKSKRNFWLSKCLKSVNVDKKNFSFKYINWSVWLKLTMLFSVSKLTIWFWHYHHIQTKIMQCFDENCYYKYDFL